MLSGQAAAAAAEPQQRFNSFSGKQGSYHISLFFLLRIQRRWPSNQNYAINVTKICRLDKQLQQLQICRTAMEIEFTKLAKSNVTLEAGQLQMINTLAILGETAGKYIVLKSKSSSTVQQYFHEVFNSRQNDSCNKTRQQSFEDQRTR